MGFGWLNARPFRVAPAKARRRKQRLRILKRPSRFVWKLGRSAVCRSQWKLAKSKCSSSARSPSSPKDKALNRGPRRILGRGKGRRRLSLKFLFLRTAILKSTVFITTFSGGQLLARRRRDRGVRERRKVFSASSAPPRESKVIKNWLRLATLSIPRFSLSPNFAFQKIPAASCCLYLFPPPQRLLHDFCRHKMTHESFV